MKYALATQPKLNGCKLVRCPSDPKALMLVFDPDLPANYWDDTPEASADDTKPRLAESTSEQPQMRGCEEKRNADSKPLDWKSMQCIEQECGTYWAKDIGERNRVYVEEEMDRGILPELRSRALNDGLTEQQYREIVAVAWLNAKTLFSALHFNVHEMWPRYEERPKFFWLHLELSSFNPGLSFLRLGNKARGFAISKDALVSSAAH